MAEKMSERKAKQLHKYYTVVEPMIILIRKDKICCAVLKTRKKDTQHNIGYIENAENRT
jgi:hypothetical protein